MGKLNCWEFKKCGRQPGGENVFEMGVCPAATAAQAHGVHDGDRGGRACWAIVGTLCQGELQDSLAAKLRNCVGCEFRVLVEAEEGAALVPPAQLSEKLAGHGAF